LENLLLLVAYDSDETGFWRRARYIGAVWFGAAMFIPELQTHTITRFQPFVVVLLNATAGLLAGFLLTASLRMGGRLLTAGVYAGHPRFIDPPPTDLRACYQLPCN